MFKMKKTNYILVLFALTLIFLGTALPVPLLAGGNSSVYDNGNYLTEQEKRSLENSVSEQEEKGGIDIILITAEDLPQYQCIRYMEDFFDQYYDNGTISKDAALLLYASDSQGRYLEIQGYGNAEYFINNKRIEAILDEISPYFKNNDISQGFLRFADEAARYMNRNPKKDSILYHPLLHLLVAVLTGGILVGVMAFRSGGKVTTNNATYLDMAHSGIVARRDQYIRTSVTKRRKPQQSSSGGGSSHSGVSRGGRSHSGGGRRL